jgi:hypothetical protein
MPRSIKFLGGEMCPGPEPEDFFKWTAYAQRRPPVKS